MAHKSEYKKINRKDVKPLLLTSQEVMVKLNIGRNTLHDLTKTGRIKSIVINQRCLRYKPEDVETFVQQLPEAKAAS